MLQIDGLGDKIVGPQTHGLDRLVDAAVTGHHDDRRGSIAFLDFLDEFHPLEAGHHQVCQKNAVVLFGEGLQRRRAIADGIHMNIGIGLKQLLQSEIRLFVVFRKKNAPLHDDHLPEKTGHPLPG